MDPAVIVLAHPRVRGGRSTIEAESMPLSGALTRRFAGDAHMQPATQSITAGLCATETGTATKVARRRTVTADIGAARILLVAAAFDFDAPNHATSDAWWAEQRERLHALDAVHPGAFTYRTRHGFRLVWSLAQPFELRTSADAAAWTGSYLALCDRWANFGLVADRSCADPYRLFRLPHATRDHGGTPEELETSGDPHAIGVLELPPAPAAQPRPLAAAEGLEGPAKSRGGWPNLLGLLRSRGAVVRQHGPTAWAIRCPNEAQHTKGTAGDGSTLYYADASPYLQCLHAHCAELTQADWHALICGYVVRRGRVRRCIVDYYERSVRMCCELDATDAGERLPYLRVTAGTRAWAALWEAAGVEPPRDLDEDGDLGGAIDEITGREIVIELDGGVTRRILPLLAAA